MRQKEAFLEQSHMLKQDKKSSTMLGEQEKVKASLDDIRKMSLNHGWCCSAENTWMVCQE